jgi:hypothetical protein
MPDYTKALSRKEYKSAQATVAADGHAGAATHGEHATEENHEGDTHGGH